MQNFETLGQISDYPPCAPKYSIKVCGGGVVPDFFGLESYYFCELGAHAKFRNPKTTPSGILITAEEEWKKKNTKNSDLPKLLRWSHALLSDQFTCLKELY